MASERIEKLLAMQQKAEAQKRKAEQQLKAAKQPHPVRGRTYTHLRCAVRSPKAPAGCSMPSASTGASPCADCIGYPMTALCAEKRR